MIKNSFKRLVAIMSAFLLLCVASGCGGDEPEATSSNQESSVNSSVESQLQPITVFFPDEYIHVVAQNDGADKELINVKGNVAVDMKENSIRVYNPTTSGETSYNGKYKTKGGVGYGSTLKEISTVYGLNQSNTIFYNKEGAVTDYSLQSKSGYRIMAAVIILNEDGSISYLEGEKIATAARSLNEQGIMYLQNADLGNDVLLVWATCDGGNKATELTLMHFTI